MKGNLCFISKPLNPEFQPQTVHFWTNKAFNRNTYVVKILLGHSSSCIDKQYNEIERHSCEKEPMGVHAAWNILYRNKFCLETMFNNMGLRNSVIVQLGVVYKVFFLCRIRMLPQNWFITSGF